MLSYRIQSRLLVGAVVLLAACSNDNSPTAPGSQFSTIQLNATTAPVYLTLGSTGYRRDGHESDDLHGLGSRVHVDRRERERRRQRPRRREGVLPLREQSLSRRRRSKH